MRRYFDTYEKATPNYTGKLWLGAAAYAEQAFVGRSSARGAAAPRLDALAPGSTHDLALVKDGAGRMYYRVGITLRAEARPTCRRSTPASSCAAATPPSTIRPTSPRARRPHADPARRARAGPLEALNTTPRYRSRSSIRCRPASRRSTRRSRPPSAPRDAERRPRWDFTQPARQPQRGVRDASSREGTHRSRTPCARPRRARSSRRRRRPRRCTAPRPSAGRRARRS